MKLHQHLRRYVNINVNMFRLMCSDFTFQLVYMADPALALVKTTDTAKREWIGGLDGLLLGFERMCGSTTEQISVANVQLIEFITTQRHTGLQALAN